MSLRELPAEFRDAVVAKHKPGEDYYTNFCSSARSDVQKKQLFMKKNYFKSPLIQNK